MSHFAPMRIEVVEELGERAAAWDDLVDRMAVPTPFLRSWWLANVADGEPQFVLVLDAGGALRGGLALQRRQRGGIEWLQFCGSGPLEPDHLDLVADHGSAPEVARLLGEWLGRPGSRVIDLSGLVRGARIASAVPGWGTQVDLEVAPFAVLSSTIEQYMATRPARMRNTVTRTAKRLTKAGVTFEVVGVDGVDGALESLHRLHDGRWGEQSEFLDRWDTFAAAMRSGAAAGEVRFHQLVTTAGEVVAIEVEFVVAKRMSFYQAGRLTGREWRGAGSVLRFDVISSAIDEGMVEYDLLRGGENYKVEWANGERRLQRVRKGVGPLGIAVVAVARANQVLQTRRLEVGRSIAALRARRRGADDEGAIELQPILGSSAVATAEPVEHTVVFYTDAQQLGGAESVAKNLLRELDPNFIVTIVGTDRAVVDEIASVRPSAAIRLLPHIGDKRDVRAMMAHRQEFARLAPDLFHFNLSDGSSCQYALLLATTIRGSRIVVTENSPMGVRSGLSRRIKRHSIARVAAHVAVGNAAASMIEDDIGLPRGSMRVIPNAVPVIDLEPPPRRDAVLTVGAVSRFDPVKGLDVLLRAMALVDVGRLVIVGEGAERGALELLAAELGLEDRIELTGWVDDSRHLLPNFDIFVLPSRLEGMPMSLIEAMHAGVATVATDVGSVREVITHGVSGLVVAPDDPAALAGALTRLLADPVERTALALAGQRIALERFTSDTNVAAYEALYREVLAGPPRAGTRAGAGSATGRRRSR